MTEVKCPRCKSSTFFSPDNPFRPFCSERCQMIDLGKWANEEFAISAQDSEDSVNSESDYSEEDY